MTMVMTIVMTIVIAMVTSILVLSYTAVTCALCIMASMGNKASANKCEFSVCSFNVWCPYWNRDCNESNHPKLWQKRHKNILQLLCNTDLKQNDDDETNINNTDLKQNEQVIDDNDNMLKPMNCDIFCIQEFWCDDEEFVKLYRNYLNKMNYSLHFLTRSANFKPDGVAMIINESKFKVVNKIEYEYTVSNRVAIVMELKHREHGFVLTAGNTHFTYPAAFYDVSIRKNECNQLIKLLDGKVSKHSELMLLSGDFNCDIDGAQCIQCIDNKYLSSFHFCNKPETKTKIVSHFNHKKQSIFCDHIFFKDNIKLKKKNKNVEIKPVESYLYPRNITTEKWPTPDQWNLSDHRPLITIFAAQKQ
eukprot:239586_1